MHSSANAQPVISSKTPRTQHNTAIAHAHTSTRMPTDTEPVSQHDKLRKRLEEELSQLKSSSENADYDWFLTGISSAISDGNKNALDGTIGSSNNTNTASDVSETKKEDTVKPPIATPFSVPISPLKSPTMANQPNVKSHPTLSTNTDDYSAPLSKVRTADARMLTPMSRINTGGSLGGLHRTATNVETSDIGRSKIVQSKPKPHNPQPISTGPLHPPTPQKKKGFFKRIFGSKSDDTKPEMNIYNSPSHSPTTSTPASTLASRSTPSSSGVSSPSALSRSASHIEAKISPANSTSSTIKSPTHQKSEPSTASAKLEATLSSEYKDIDPELAGYIKEFENTEIPKEDAVTLRSAKSYNYIYTPSGIDSVKYDEEHIPAHPDTPKTPSALATNPRFGGPIEKEIFLRQKKEREEKESSVFGSLLHKTKTNSPETFLFSGMMNESEDTPPFSFQPLHYTAPPERVDRKPPLRELTTLKPMKKVAFAATTFVNDPPQQIPSRNPRKGNVEICANGELIIHKIDPQEKINAATGIVVGGTGHLKLINQDEASTTGADANMGNTNNMSIDVPNTASMTKAPSVQSMISQTSGDQTIKSEDRALAAKKAREHHGFENIDVQKEGLKIDKPMVRRKRQMDVPVVKLKLDELYTRCCHLREILPIPATLKQIPKGSTDPIPMLHLRNPRPSMIEILSFTDFIRIAPVICISLDGVSLTREMFRIILSSLLYKRYLEKLSLRNTPIDEEGWRMLCLFLSMNKSLKKIDITQCPSLDVNTQRMKKKAKPGAEVRMTCNVNDRSDRNWALLTASIIFRGGIDDIILTGCKIPDLKLFSNLLNLALVDTTKIGLAYNSLTLQHCYVIARWLKINNRVVGIDLAFNDLSSNLQPFIQYLTNEDSNDNSLFMMSLNSCNLIDCEETDQFFSALSKSTHLTYIDLSSNAKLLKTYLNKLSIYLPLFDKLARLCINNNDLDNRAMVQFLESVPLMSKLNYLSIKGNAIDDCVLHSLCKALKNTPSLYSIDFDSDKVEPAIVERIGLLTMKNIEQQLYKQKDDFKIKKGHSFVDMISEQDRKIIKEELGLTDSMSFTDALFTVLKGKKVDTKKLDKFLGIIVMVRTNMKTLIQALLDSHNKDKLSVDGKEMLIRLWSMDASIDKAIELINNKKLNSTKESTDAVFDTSKYDAYLKNMFEHDKTNPLDDLILDLKKNPDHCDKLRSMILSTSDPYDMIQMIKYCKYNKIDIEDLFLKRYSESDSESSSVSISKGNDQLEHSSEVLLHDDDASIDSQESEVDGDVHENASEEDNAKLLRIYDLILKDMVKRSPVQNQHRATSR
jgi:hypothetical protein